MNARVSVAIAVIAVVTGALPSDAIADAKIDWGAGFIVARGIGVANRAAPTPAAARGPARRAAEDAARRELRAALPALALASGGTLSKKLGEPRIKTAIDAALLSAVTIFAEPETDGSWKVTLGLPVEALRQAIATGPRAVTRSDAALPVVVVEGVTVKPAIGYKVGALAAATVWMAEMPTWAQQAPRVKVRSIANGTIAVDLPAKATDATLFVLMR